MEAPSRPDIYSLVFATSPSGSTPIGYCLVNKWNRQKFLFQSASLVGQKFLIKFSLCRCEIVRRLSPSTDLFGYRRATMRFVHFFRHQSVVGRRQRVGAHVDVS